MKKLLFALLFSTTLFQVLSAQEEVNISDMLMPHGKYEPPKNFQETVANFFMSKRFKTATKQRDSLQEIGQQLKYDMASANEENDLLRKDTAQLGKALRLCRSTKDALQSTHRSLKNDYLALEKVSSRTQKFLSNELSEKATRLELLEIALNEREKRLKELEAIIQKQDSIMQALHNAIKNALLQFDADELSIELKNGKIYVSLSDKILFASGKAEVGEKGIAAINKLSGALMNIPKVDIMVEGHTDNVPIKTAQYRDNWDLSVARSTAITRLMIELGVNPKQIIASGRAEFSPKASNERPEGRAKNRRTEVILIPNLDALYNLISKR